MLNLRRTPPPRMRRVNSFMQLEETGEIVAAAFGCNSEWNRSAGVRLPGGRTPFRIGASWLRRQNLMAKSMPSASNCNAITKLVDRRQLLWHYLVAYVATLFSWRICVLLHEFI